MLKITNKHQYINNEDIQLVTKTLKGNFLTGGPLVDIFESKLNNYFGGKYCNVVSSGTSALHLSGLVLGWKKNDIVIVSPITFLSTVNCIEYQKAKPDFVDIEPYTYTIDVNKLEDKIKKYKKNNKKIKAVIGVDYAGHPCDWIALRYLANRYNFMLINDNCHALGSKYYRSLKYSTKYADLVTQSYHTVKNITTGEGGAVLTNNKYFYEKIKYLRSHGMIRDKKKLPKDSGGWFYEMQNLGYNFRLSEIQCALGISQLKKLDKFIKKRNKIAEIYNNYLAKDERLTVPYVSSQVTHSYHLYPLQINFKRLKITKKLFYNRLLKKGIFLNVHYIPVHTQPYYKKKYKFKNDNLENAMNFYENEFSLPMHPNLKTSDVNYIIKQIINNLY